MVFHTNLYYCVLGLLEVTLLGLLYKEPPLRAPVLFPLGPLGHRSVDFCP